MTTHLTHYGVSTKCEKGSQGNKKQKVITLARLEWLAHGHMKYKSDQV